MAHRASLSSLLLLLFGLTIVCACGGSQPTQLTSSWVDEDFEGGPIESVLVIAIAETAEGRELFENEFADELRHHGVDATTSLELLGPDVELTRENLIAAWETTNIDAALVSSIVELDTDDYVEPHMQYGSSNLFTYVDQTTVASRDTHPSDIHVVLETNLYDISTEEAVWSAQTETFSTASTNTIIGDKIDLLVANLVSRGLVE